MQVAGVYVQLQGYYFTRVTIEVLSCPFFSVSIQRHQLTAPQKTKICHKRWFRCHTTRRTIQLLLTVLSRSVTRVVHNWWSSKQNQPLIRRDNNGNLSPAQKVEISLHNFVHRARVSLATQKLRKTFLATKKFWKSFLSSQKFGKPFVIPVNFRHFRSLLPSQEFRKSLFVPVNFRIARSLFAP